MTKATEQLAVEHAKMLDIVEWVAGGMEDVESPLRAPEATQRAGVFLKNWVTRR